MRLIDDAHLVVKHAWSVRFIAFASVLSGLEVTIQVMLVFQIDPHMPAGVFAGAAGACSVAAFVARFVAQEKISGANNP